MEIITKAYARAGLLGNPSDGFFGKTIAIIVKNFEAKVILHQSGKLEINQNSGESTEFDSLSALVKFIESNGYDEYEPLIKAAIKSFFDYCTENNIPLKDDNFSISYSTTIPRQVGLGGSSAIITAALHALMQFYNVNIPKPIQPNIILAAEKDELKINAGLMDRVIQVYEDCVYMDFDRQLIETYGHGKYERIDPNQLPGLFIAYHPDLRKVSGDVLSSIRAGYESGNKTVLYALKRLGEIAEEGKAAVENLECSLLKSLMKENFTLRRSIMHIDENNLTLVEMAEKCGAAAKFAGSGGSVIGIIDDNKMYNKLEKEFSLIGAKIFKPVFD
jgi:glucuronokinase